MRLLPLLVLSLLGALVQGEAVFDLQPSTQKCFGMYSKKSIPGAKKSPYIGLNIAEIQGESSYIIFNYEDRDAIGYRHSETGEVSYICTQALKDANKCHSSEVNEFIVNDTKKHVSPIMKGGTYQIEDDDIIVNYEVEKKGYYCVFHQNLTQFSMVGVLKIQNPYGNLPADIYPNLPFYGTMSLVYLGVAILWGILCLCYWQQIMHIQLYINAIIFLCLCEMAFGYGYHTNYNISGTPSMGLLTFTVLLTSARNSASFIALLVVCMGYGVVKPTLGSTAKKIAAIGFAHFIFGTLFAASSMLQTASSQKLLALLFVFPLALTMTILYSWTFNSLNVTIKKLEIRRQSTKTTLYRRLWQLLAFSLLILFIFLIMTIVQRYDPQYEVEHWDTIWFTSDGWIHLLYFFMFIAILFLFRPTKNNNRYGMIEAATDDVDDGAMGSSAALANIKMRGLKRSKRQEESDEEDALQWVEENISDGEEIDPLTLEEEPEERIARRELAKMN